MITLREITFDELMANATALFVEHVAELNFESQGLHLQVNAAKYRAMEAEAAFFVIGAFDGGRLIGYSTNFIVDHLQFAARLCANDSIFLAKDYRGTQTGVKLIWLTETIGKERGARKMQWSAKPNTPLASILPRLGCSIQEINFMKDL
jgi:predicted GNAT superfamily acetyltransferase